MRMRTLSSGVGSLPFVAGITLVLIGAVQDVASRFALADGSGRASSTAGCLLLCAALVIGSSACADMPTLPSTTITSLSITGTPPSVGATSQYAASVVVPSASTVQDVTTLATWQSADTTIATVSKNGLVTGIKVGSTKLTATYNGTSVTAQLSIP
jgi:hypothetical protein